MLARGGERERGREGGREGEREKKTERLLFGDERKLAGDRRERETEES